MTEPTNLNPGEWGGEESGALNGESGEGLSDLLIELVKPQQGVTTICDLGCANGYLSHRLAAAGYRVTGIDGSVPYIATAKRLHGSPPVRFEQAFFSPSLATTLSTEPFDLVISSDVIEHLYHPMGLLETAHALLKPGGMLILGTPYHGYLKNVAISLLGKWDAHHGVHWDGGHIKFFSVNTMRRMVERGGFADTHFHFYGRTHAFAKNMICIARRQA
ncbi:MAG: class I SAM-dependent methyltransferase [Acidobacteriota bacterium]